MEGSKGSELSWADQWDYKYNDEETTRGYHADEGSSRKKKLTEYNQKLKSASKTGFVKAKSAAVVGAGKVKAGTSTGIKWVKEQYHKRTQH
ncbi:hypothetical protein O6H91_05G009600 [Diphasiastrum complanatum]|uniref:Uncharacterized protein n=1 Tax=Diphasiastrum complanatum TaxID=34168 RepID=A0ACC2DKP6_DIPCM|nr:hypothetical protein O6H91_05G009600 [Diphasiastrum complanatum]